MMRFDQLRFSSLIIQQYHTHIKFCGLNFHVFDWQENLWGINFRGHDSVVGTIVVGSAKYARYCGLIFVDRGIPRNLRQCIHLENFYAYSSKRLIFCVLSISRLQEEIQELRKDREN